MISMYFYNQIAMLREFAIKQLGAEKVAHMSDSDLNKWLEGEYDLCYGIGINGDCDDEIIYALPKGTLEKAVYFSR